jgi:hypothetical protein
MRLPGRVWIQIHRVQNRLQDLRAWFAGACNASTWDGETYAGGYSHWRCGRARGHLKTGQPHRFKNYIWVPGKQVKHDPIPVASEAGHRLQWREELPYDRESSGRAPTDRRGRARAQRAYWKRGGVRRSPGSGPQWDTEDAQRDRAV